MKPQRPTSVPSVGTLSQPWGLCLSGCRQEAAPSLGNWASWRHKAARRPFPFAAITVPTSASATKALALCFAQTPTACVSTHVLCACFSRRFAEGTRGVCVPGERGPQKRLLAAGA